MNPYLEFEVSDSPSGKTKVVWIWKVGESILLGRIAWFGRWRQYAFYPEPGTIWNPDCLESVNVEIRRLMEERRTENRSVKGDS